MKTLNPAKPWAPRDHFTGSGYYTHNAEGYVPKLESLVLPSLPPPVGEQRRTSRVYMFLGTLMILVLELISRQG